MPFNPKSDVYDDYFIVMESTSPENNRANNLKVIEQNGLSFLRFSTCLQDFHGYNRNRRKWPAPIVKKMAEAPHIIELIKAGSFVGEAGHPVPDSGKVTVERILNINPKNTSHRITSLSWPKSDELHGVVETLDEGPGTPGNRMMRNILQGVVPAFSLRALVPQHKNADGSIDVVGVGRMVCYDRVYLPSHEGAYMDVTIPVKNVVTKSKFETVMESFNDYVMEHSDKIRGIVDAMEPVMESANYDPKTGFMGIKTAEGQVFIAPEAKYRNEIASSLDSFLF